MFRFYSLEPTPIPENTERLANQGDFAKEIQEIFEQADVRENVGRVTGQRGAVLSVADFDAPVGSLVIFNNDPNWTGLVLTLDQEHVYVVVFGSKLPPLEASVQLDQNGLFCPAQDTLGRMLNAMGSPIDDGPPITLGNKVIDVFGQPGPPISARVPVRVMLQTGIKFIDLFKPLARGHRMALLGPDNARGSFLCLDIIAYQAALNASRPESERMHFVWVCLGRNERHAAQIKATLSAKGAWPYSTMVVASNKDGMASLYAAPFTGSAVSGQAMIEYCSSPFQAVPSRAACETTASTSSWSTYMHAHAYACTHT
jgi:F0F1-type ATP synthase alpha subunit